MRLCWGCSGMVGGGSVGPITMSAQRGCPLTQAGGVGEEGSPDWQQFWDCGDGLQEGMKEGKGLC